MGPDGAEAFQQGGPPAPMRIVWIDSVAPYRDWLRFVSGDLWGDETVEKAWPVPQPRTLYGIDTNWHPLDRIPKSFLDQVAATPGVGLFHTDEWLREDYDAYRRFSFVVRLFQARGVDGPGVRTLAHGWPNGGQVTTELAPASARPVAWFFAGALIASRPEMVRAFTRHVPGGDCNAYEPDLSNPRPLSRDAFRARLEQTVFIPAGMGNVVAETWRFYEALEAGAIPITERRVTLDYYRELLGPHPVPTFRNWDAAARFARDLLGRPDKLDALQAEVSGWWSAHKIDLRRETPNFLSEGLNDSFRPALSQRAFPTGLRRDLWQYTELLRHQSVGSLRRQIKKRLKRGSLRRDMSHLTGGL
jgi:hypothetical protein